MASNAYNQEHSSSHDVLARTQRKKPVENNSQAEVEIDSTTKKETSSTIKKDNNHGSRAAALFNNLEEGGSRDIIDDDHENDKSLNSLQDRVVFLKRVVKYECRMYHGLQAVSIGRLKVLIEYLEAVIGTQASVYPLAVGHTIDSLSIFPSAYYVQWRSYEEIGEGYGPPTTLSHSVNAYPPILRNSDMSEREKETPGSQVKGVFDDLSAEHLPLRHVFHDTAHGVKCVSAHQPSLRDMTKDKDSGETSKKELSTTNTSQFQCPLLKPSNYSLWAIRMQIILEANGLWEMIEPNDNTVEDNTKEKTAIAFLYQALPEEQLLQITKHKTAKEIWTALKTKHVGEERVQQARLQTLKSEFEGILQLISSKMTKSHERSNLVEEELEPTLLMAILDKEREVVDQEVSLHEEDVGYKETTKDSQWYWLMENVTTCGDERYFEILMRRLVESQVLEMDYTLKSKRKGSL
ncbi:zinc finger, CCHC-type containing protein [Tanacetum coccineum]